MFNIYVYIGEIRGIGPKKINPVVPVSRPTLQFTFRPYFFWVVAGQPGDKMASVVTVIVEPCLHNMTQKRFFASVPHHKTLHELLVEYHGIPTSDCKIETTQEEHLRWTSLPFELSDDLTLQSLISFKIKYLKISCTGEQQESAEEDNISERRNAFTVLMARERGMPQKRKSR